jgi:hypothetical protein
LLRQRPAMRATISARMAAPPSLKINLVRLRVDINLRHASLTDSRRFRRITWVLSRNHAYIQSVASHIGAIRCRDAQCRRLGEKIVEVYERLQSVQQRPLTPEFSVNACTDNCRGCRL